MPHVLDEHQPRTGHEFRRSPPTAGREELRRWLCETKPDRSQRNESSLCLFLTPLLEPGDREATYRRDLAQVEDDLAMLTALRDGADDAADPEVFAPQVELDIRINGVLKDWLVEQIAFARRRRKHREQSWNEVARTTRTYLVQGTGQFSNLSPVCKANCSTRR